MEKSQEKFAVFAEDFALFIEAGFVAIKQLDEVSATRIFTAAQMLRPESAAPHIGFGYIALNKLEVKKASEIFETVLEEEPDHHLAQTLLGISYLLSKGKQKKGEALIKEAMSKTTDPTVKNLGEISLQWNEKDLSKKKSLFFEKPDSEEEK